MNIVELKDGTNIEIEKMEFVLGELLNCSMRIREFNRFRTTVLWQIKEYSNRVKWREVEK